MLGFYLTLIEKEGDKRRFEKIYETYNYQMLYISIHILEDKFLSEDAVQDSFLYIARNMSKTEGKNENEVKGYVFIITKHKAIDIVRKYQRYREIDKLMEISFAVAPSAEKLAMEREETRVITAAILILPVIYRECLMLILFYEYSIRELAVLMNLSYEVAKKRVARGKAKLRSTLDER